jgi:hypothetical protein
MLRERKIINENESVRRMKDQTHRHLHLVKDKMERRQ